MLKHFPDSWIAPEIRGLLWPDLDPEIVVAALERVGGCENLLEVKADHVLSGLLERIIECSFVFASLSLSIGDQSIAVTNEYQYSSLVYSIQRGDIRDRV
jgi:hypothetical protein